MIDFGAAPLIPDDFGSAPGVTHLAVLGAIGITEPATIRIPMAGSDSSAVDEVKPLLAAPPVTSNFPLDSSVVVWLPRALMNAMAMEKEAAAASLGLSID